MSYADFKTYVRDFLWKKSDQGLIDRLDNLVAQAESELETNLRTKARDASVVLVPASDTSDLPTDLDTPRSLAFLTPVSLAPAGFISPHRLEETRKMYGTTIVNVYSYFANQLLLSGGTPDQYATGQITLRLFYKRNVNSFLADDTSWVYDAHPDLYLYAVLKETAPFLREDERLPMWVETYEAKLRKVNENYDFYHGTSYRQDAPLPQTARQYPNRGGR